MAAMMPPYEPIEMAVLKHISQDMPAAGAVLKKMDSGRDGSYDATASSLECIKSLHGYRRGLRCKVSGGNGQYGQHFMIGLASTTAGFEEHPQQARRRESEDYKFISYGVVIANDGNVYVFESGMSIGQFGTWTGGDEIKIGLSSEELPRIEYKVNGELRYTSTKDASAQVPLFAKVCAWGRTALVEELQWILEKDPQIPELQTSIMALETQITQQQTQLQASEGEKHRLQAAVEEKEERLQRLQEENNALRDQSTQQRQLMEEELQAASRAAIDERLQLQDQMQHLRDENSGLRDQRAQLQEQMEDQMQHLRDENSGLRDQRAQLQEQMEDRLRAASRAATDEKEELQERLQRQQEEINGLRDQTAQLRQQKDEELQTASRAATDERLQLQERLQRLQEENDALRDQSAQQRQQMEEELQAASRAATDERLQLQERVQRQQAEINALRDQRAQLRQQMQEELQTASRAANDERQQLQVQAMQLQGLNEALRAAMGRLTEQIAQQEVHEMQLQAREELRRRQSTQHSETSSEDWEQLGSSTAASIGGITA